MKDSHNYALGLTWSIILFLVPLPMIQSLAVGLPVAYADEFQAIYFGAIAYTWMLVAIYLSTRPKWLDRLIGLPNMYLIHGIISIAAVFLAYLHQSQTQSIGWIKTTGDWAYWLLVGVLGYSLIFMAGWLSSRINIVRLIKLWLAPIFRHEVSIWIHRLNLVATVLVFIHVTLIDYVMAIKPFMFWFYLYSGLTLVSYLWSKYRNWTKITNALLISNREIATNVRELTLHPNSHISTLTGDYIFVAFPTIQGLSELHPFSLVNSRPEAGKIVLAIRGDGDFTRSLNQVQPGTPAKMTGGYGRYQPFLDEHSGFQNMVIIAGGIGVVPLLSIIGSHPDVHIQLFYTAHRKSDLLYSEKLDVWQRRTTFQLFQQVGRFDDAEIIHQLPSNWQGNTIFLLGGPSKMTRHWRRVLLRHGALRKHIYAEEFDW